MPKPTQRLEFNTFIKGLITEASSLNFPANASLDEENFVLHGDGSRSRRLGMDYEASSSTRLVSSSDISTLGRNTYRWMVANGDVNKNFLVQQLGNVLYFYDLSASSISGTGYVGTITLSSLSTTITYSFASIEGRLVIAADYIKIAIVSVTAANAFSVTYTGISVRDLWGVEDVGAYETRPDYRDNTYHDYHGYNLLNQGWGIPRKKPDGTLFDPIMAYQTALSQYPSNVETPWQGMQFRAAASTTEAPSERLYPEMFDSLRGATAPAAKGYFIIDLLNRGLTRIIAGLNNSAQYPEMTIGTFLTVPDPFTPATYKLPQDYTSGGATVVEDFAGRVFFAGFRGDVTLGDARSPILTNYVVFSQLVRNWNDITKCYQVGDPTSRDSGDLLDTDGGFVRIAGARKIVALKNMGTALVVLAENGVWSIDGGNNNGFSATNYKVSKVSNYGCVSPKSIVVEGDRVYFASDTGIYVIGRSQIGDLVVDSITLNTVQSYYDSIPLASKKQMTSVYDLNDKKLRWQYKTGTEFTSNSATYEIVFDVRLGAFSRNRIYRSTANDVEISSGFLDLNNTLKYVTFRKVSTSYYLVFSQYKSTDFKDWSSLGTGADAKAYLITGSFTGGDSAIEKQSPYLVVSFERTESGVDSNLVPLQQSSCFVRSQWDWSNTVASKKWSPLFQAYRYKRPVFVTGLTDTYDNGFEVISTKSKLRGRGKALSLYFETEASKDCRILGWNIGINGNQIA